MIRNRQVNVIDANGKKHDDDNGRFVKKDGGGGGTASKKPTSATPDKSIPKSSMSYEQRKTALNGALQKLVDGSPEATMPNLRSDLDQFGGTNDVTLMMGDKKKGLIHIEKGQSGVIDRFSPSNPTHNRAIFSHPEMGADSALMDTIARLFAKSNKNSGKCLNINININFQGASSVYPRLPR